MQFLDEQYLPIPDLKDSLNKYCWIYDLDKRDFYLRPYYAWNILKTETYRVLIDEKHELDVPANFYCVIGDLNGGLDVITFAEIIGRPFDIFVFSPALHEHSWSLRPMKIIGHQEELEFYIPYSKHPLPVWINEKLAFLVSQNDIYNKIKHLDFTDIL